MLAVDCRICQKPTNIQVDQDPLCPGCARLGQALRDIVPFPEPERYCIHYAPRHTGWIEVVDARHVRIANVPSCTGLNLHDVVTLRKPYKCCGRPVADKVVQRIYNQKTLVCYYQKEDYPVMRKLLESHGAWCEGWYGPDGQNPGWCGVAHRDHVDLPRLLRGTGLRFDCVPIELGPGRRGFP